MKFKIECTVMERISVPKVFVIEAKDEAEARKYKCISKDLKAKGQIKELDYISKILSVSKVEEPKCSICRKPSLSKLNEFFARDLSKRTIVVNGKVHHDETKILMCSECLKEYLVFCYTSNFAPDDKGATTQFLVDKHLTIYEFNRLERSIF